MYLKICWEIERKMLEKDSKLKSDAADNGIEIFSLSLGLSFFFISKTIIQFPSNCFPWNRTST